MLARTKLSSPRRREELSVHSQLAVGLSIADDTLKVSEAHVAITILVCQPVRETNNTVREEEERGGEEMGEEMRGEKWRIEGGEKKHTSLW